MSNSRLQPHHPPPHAKFYSTWDEIPVKWRNGVTFVGELHLQGVPTRFWFRGVCSDQDHSIQFDTVIMDCSQRVDGICLRAEYAIARMVNVSKAVPFLFMPWHSREMTDQVEKGGGE